MPDFVCFHRRTFKYHRKFLGLWLGQVARVWERKTANQPKGVGFCGRRPATRAVHGSGRVGFRPNPTSTRRRRVEGRSNPKPTTGKIGRFNFLWWLASIGSYQLPELKKASKSEEKASPESGIFAGIWKFLPKTGKFRRKLENSRRKLDFFWNMLFFFR